MDTLTDPILIQPATHLHTTDHRDTYPFDHPSIIHPSITYPHSTILQSIHLSITYPFDHPSIHPSIHPLLSHPSTHPIDLSSHPPTCPFISLPTPLPRHPLTYPPSAEPPTHTLSVLTMYLPPSITHTHTHTFHVHAKSSPQVHRQMLEMRGGPGFQGATTLGCTVCYHGNSISLAKFSHLLAPKNNLETGKHQRT